MRAARLSRLRPGWAVVDACEATAPHASLHASLRTLWPDRFTSASAAKKACRRSLVHVDGCVGSSAQPVAVGARIQLLARVAAGPAAGTPGSRRAVPDQALEIRYEDDHCAVVYKPAGLDVGAVRQLLACSLEPSRATSLEPLWRPQHVHRLDKETSGLLLAAKTGQSLRTLSAAFASRLVHKTYAAIVVGALGVAGGPTSCISADLSGSRALTHWSAVSHHSHAEYGTVTLLDLHPHTGRTHQLRRHCQMLGHPILGDARYWDRQHGPCHDAAGAGAAGVGLCLSSVGIELPHPHSGELLRVRAPKPEAWAPLLSERVE